MSEIKNNNEVNNDEKDHDNKSTLIKSVKIVAGSRTYFFDVKSTLKTNAKYLSISEKRFNDNNPKNVERNRIIVFDEYLENFLQGLNKVLK